MNRQPKLGTDEAETIALTALAFLASDGERLGRFLALTGLGPAELKHKARDPLVLTGVLDHLMQDETLLMVLAAETSLDPQSIADAHALLSGAQAAGRN